MKSMTGYGSATVCSDGVKISIHISSYNRKQSDIRISLPKEMVHFEYDIRNRINDATQRGVVNVKIDSEVNNGQLGLLALDAPLAQEAYQILRNLKEDLGLEDKVTISDLLTLPEISIFKKRELADETLKSIIFDSLNQALAAWDKTKCNEGTALRKDLNKRHSLLHSNLKEISKVAPLVPDRYQKKLLSRLKEFSESLPDDRDRICKEVAIFADRCDISEELTRITAHLNSMKDLFKSDSLVGRKLEFMVQEILREINTIGSKANDLDISANVIEFKAELERIREQVQNIE